MCKKNSNFARKIKFSMDISIIVPLFNEAESLPHLYEWIARVMKENKFSYELIFVNDGSSDESWQVIQSLREQSKFVRGICFRRNYGKLCIVDSRRRKAM